jgi:5-methyltetrahydropteroyltriglutamate--homocysteine methyltransferase
MQTHLLGYPRIGSQRELKRACEQYWSGKITIQELLQVGRDICLQNWKMQQEAGIDLIPCNDFSYYDQVLDMSLTVGAIPVRYQEAALRKSDTELDLYFAMARGCQEDGLDITAMEMTKWFDTNYHYIVPEFYRNQQFRLTSNKIFSEFEDAIQAGIHAKPVIIGPVSYLLLGKEKEEGFDRLDLMKNLLPVYIDILSKLQKQGATWVQFDEPFLTMDLTEKIRNAYSTVYKEIRKKFPELKFVLATYFEGLKDNLPLTVSLPIDVLHIDLVRDPGQLDDVLSAISESSCLSLGIVDGRNIWKNDFSKSLSFIRKAIEKLGSDRIFIAPSCSLLHTPCDLDFESTLNPKIKNWLAFAKQKVEEVIALKVLAGKINQGEAFKALEDNKHALEDRRTSLLIHNDAVKKRVSAVSENDIRRNSPFTIRKREQQKVLKLPLFPTTTIGSFPQTKAVRSWRARFKKGELTEAQYDAFLKEEIARTIRRQEEIGIDVLVHGEFERNDMVEYFGEHLAGFAFTGNGWVQSYGSRCVKPPIIFGDIFRPEPITVYWSQYAQSLTGKPVKGMLTGPVTILQWSFVRNDQSRSETCKQIALAIRDEVLDLEKAGIRIIQIDEPAIREGLPLRKADWPNYLRWAVECFRISSSGVQDSTQIHTHMCYSEFNDIIENIAKMDADVITIECSRSQMELLRAFGVFNYPNDIGPGVYDIHSPRIPSMEEMIKLLEKAQEVIPAHQLWVNPDCGLKTRSWEETQKALTAMVKAAKKISSSYARQRG